MNQTIHDVGTKAMKKIHIIGIGGSGLSAIALVLLELGYVVSGSDQTNSPILQQVANAGGTIFIGHKAENVKSADLVLRSSAVSDRNIEVQAAISAGIPVKKRSEFLHQLISGKQCIAVAGTHGKTTTTAMIAWIFSRTDFDPSYIIGSPSINLGKNAHAGQGNYFIIEADEYDRMFLGLAPMITAITSIEHDHPDCFPSKDDFYEVFVEFALRTERSGKVLICADDPGCRQLIDEPRLHDLTFLTYGLDGDSTFIDPPPQIVEKDYFSKDLIINNLGGFNFVFTNTALKESSIVSLRVPGVHNVKNATCALAAAVVVGIKLEQAVEAINEFGGTVRRFEVKGDIDGVLFISDYAHHPTEIKATLAAGKAHYSDKQIWAIWQPHTFSRTRLLQDEFVESFENADHVCVMDIYAARESEKVEDIDPQKIVEQIRAAKTLASKNVYYTHQVKETSEFLLKNIQPGDLVIILSAGDADRVIELVMDKLINEKKKLTGKQLSEKLGSRTEKNVLLAPYTSTRVGGPADLLIRIHSKDELVKAVNYLYECSMPFFIIGGGSNILVSDSGVRGTVLINKAKKIIFFEMNDPPYVWAESGAFLGLIARQSAQLGLSGLEWAAGIPGTVGGAVVGNAGAHGSDIARNLKMAEILHLPDENTLAASRIEQWSEKQFKYSYRSSLIKRNPGKYIVLSVELVLAHDDKKNVRNKMLEYTNYRKRTQPSGASVGSIFKNPPGDFAGRLIEKAGLKGFRVGGAEISPIHGNFFINKGNSSATDVLKLIEHTKKSVYEDSGVYLELEIELVGDWQDADWIN